MSYFPEHGAPRRRWPWLLAVMLVLVLVAGAAVLVIVGGGPRRSAPPAPISRPPASAPQSQPRLPGAPPDAFGALTSVNVAGAALPVSAVHGPRSDTSGVPAGYSHDTPGAVLAAINISYRLTGAVGPSTYQAVLFTQCYGNVDATLQQLTAASSGSSAAQVTPDQWWWQVSAGNPTGDLVEISLLARTPQSTSLGGYSEITRTLAWRDGDWRMQVPPAPPAVVTSTTGYTLLGAGHGG